MSATSGDDNKVIESFQETELDDSIEDRAVKEKTGINTPSSSSSSILDDNLFDNISDTDSVAIKRKLLMEQLRALELEEAALEQRKQEEIASSNKAMGPVKPKWNKKGELSFFESDDEENPEHTTSDNAKPATSSKDEVKDPCGKKLANQDPMTRVSDWNEEIARQKEMRSLRPPLRSSITESSNVRKHESSPSYEAIELIKEIKGRSPPRIKLGHTTTRVTPNQLHAENLKRNRIPKDHKEVEKLKGSNRPLLTTDDHRAQLAPSTAVRPAAYRPPTFKEFLGELGLEKSVRERPEKPLYFVECRMLSDEALKDLICKRAAMLVARKDSQTVTRGTQTYVSQAGKARVQGCVNCRSYTHHARDCKLPYRPGFCQICFADGFDTKDCVYPHGIEHEAALGLCVGCGTDLSLYCPECPDCNIRYKDIVDWLRLNYATWPSWAIPADHKYLVNEGVEVLKRRVKAKFDDPNDTPNRVREFLIRENALSIAPDVANRNVPTMEQLSEEKRQLAMRALVHPLTKKTLDEIIRERPELDDGEEIKIVIPTKYKHQSARK